MQNDGRLSKKRNTIQTSASSPMQTWLKNSLQALLEKVMKMTRYKTAGSILIATLIVVACMYALNVVVEPPIRPRSRLLFISSSGEYWQRTVAGAQDAARELGVDLEVVAPTPDESIDQQITTVRRSNPADYDGVAISPADPESQIELIKALAGQTKIVTFDRDGYKSRRLCHVGFAQESAGALVARLVGDQLSQPGKVALLATTFAGDVQNSNVTERLAGFMEQWGPCGQNPALPCPVVQVATDMKDLESASQDLSTILADPKLAFIVALDRRAAASALIAMAARSEARRVPIISFDPDQTIFDAIDDGRVCSAIFDDPYRSGFTAIQRLATYHGADKEGLPVPGYGTYFLVSEVVRKDNLADIRRRLDRNGVNNASTRETALPSHHKRVVQIRETTYLGEI
jgi:ribose transport system substrate-binding protein